MSNTALKLHKMGAKKPAPSVLPPGSGRGERLRVCFALL
nr:MAG TPA: hypothetical protein [Caudoviricetes sp.]